MVNEPLTMPVGPAPPASGLVRGCTIERVAEPGAGRRGRSALRLRCGETVACRDHRVERALPLRFLGADGVAAAVGEILKELAIALYRQPVGEADGNLSVGELVEDGVRPP